jgi:hypothetical protein
MGVRNTLMKIEWDEMRCRRAQFGAGSPANAPVLKARLTTLRRCVAAIGGRVIDGRTTMARSLAAWRADLVRDLGGDPSTAQLAVIELAVRTKLLLDSVDAWLLVQPSLLNARKRALLPVVRERQVLADALARYLGQSGLSRVAKDVPSLDDCLRQPAPGAAAPPARRGQR